MQYVARPLAAQSSKSYGPGTLGEWGGQRRKWKRAPMG
jgi:hypothetical protein